MTTNTHYKVVEKLSPEELALLTIRLRNKSGKIAGRGAVQRLPREEGSNVFPASFAQQRLWFVDQLEPGNATYNLSGAFRSNDKLNLTTLEETLDEIIRRHEVLRTCFPSRDGKPVQEVRAFAKIGLALIDLADIEAERQDELVRQLAQQEGALGFDLAGGVLLRAKLLLLSHDQRVLLMTMHHIVGDGWSLEVMVSELTRVYEAFRAGMRSSLPELRVQYADFAAWQTEWLQGQILQEQIEYWRRRLAGAPLLELPTDRPRPSIPNHRGARQRINLSEDLTRKLKELSTREGATLFMTLLAGFKVLMGRHARQQDIAVGTPIVGRSREETEGLIGFFVNTLVMRTDISGNPTGAELLGRVRETALGAYAHQDLPFEKLVEELQPERDLSRHPFFDILFNHADAPPSTIGLQGLSLHRLRISEVESKFPITVYTCDDNDGLTVEVVYQQALFSDQRVRVILDQYVEILSRIAERPDERLASYSLITPQSRRLIPDPTVELDEPRFDLVIEMFNSCARRLPHHTALIQRGREWTYQELSDCSERIGRELIRSGLRPGQTVMVCGERSFGLIASMLAVWFSGGVLFTLDRRLPTNRQRTMRDIAGAEHVLYVGGGREEDAWILHSDSMAAITVDSATGSLDPGFGEASCQRNTESFGGIWPVVSADDPAYIFFTSGTTGIPKGVLGCHKGLSHFLNWQREEFRISSKDRSAQLTGLSFDVVLRDIFLPLTSGATLCLPDNEEFISSGRILVWLESAGATVLHAVPSLAETWLTDLPEDLSSSKLRIVFFAGEPLTSKLVNGWREVFSSQCEIVNLYGPTETTLAKCFYRVPADPPRVTQPVGSPIPQTQALILGDGNRLCGIAEIGEIAFRTPFRSLGYINAADENRTRFVTNPFRDDDSDLIYYTGDLGRYLEDGLIEILGRVDYQVKIRGQRIEPGEIESVLMQHPEVRQCAVCVRQDEPGGRRLVAFVVSADGARGAGELRHYLEERLPEYMVPSAFVSLPNLPLTPNGKLDRSALPAPASIEGVGDREEPRTPTEEIVASIWGNVLRVNRVGVRQNFFEVGGHSLLATQVISRLQAVLNVKLPLRTLFESPTVAGLAQAVERARLAGSRPEAMAIRSRRLTDNAPLSFAQQRLWFLNQLEADKAAYNIPQAIRLQGPLNLLAVRECLQEIVRRHQVLRTRFETQNGQPRQVIDEIGQVELPVWDLSNLAECARMDSAREIFREEAARPFDLAQGPVWRARLVQLTTEDHVLLLCMHHVASDAWSIGVLVREFSALYEEFRQGRSGPLPELCVQYADFALWQREWLQGDLLREQLEYWTRQLAGVPVLELPVDRPRPAGGAHTGAKTAFALPLDLTRRLKELSRRENVTLFMTLLAGFQVLLARYTGQDDLAVGTPIAGRNRAETEGLIGFFVNTLVMRTDLRGNPTVPVVLGRVREAALEAYAHQDLPFEKLVEELQPERSLSHSPLFQVMFILQNTPRAMSELSDLRVSSEPIEAGAAKFDMTLSLAEGEEQIQGWLEYAEELFDGSRIERLAGHLRRVLEGMVGKGENRIMEISLLNGEEMEQIVWGWNETAAEYRAERCIHELFEEQAEKTPEGVAVVYQEEELSYGELNRRAEKVASYLSKLGVGPEVRVGLYLERGLEMVVGLLAVLKCGGAYVPLDREYPGERVAYMLQDSESQVIVTQRGVLKELPENGARVLCMSDWDRIEREPERAGEVGVKSENLAYVIYTSGSTGRPKGVGIEHRALTNLIDSMGKRLSFSRGATFLAVTSLSFDISMLEILLPLVSGGRAVLADREVVRDGNRLSELLRNSGATYMQATPATWKQMVDSGWSGGDELCVLCGGEALPKQLADKLCERSGELWNVYGPTETTIWSTIWRVEQREGISIGRPIENTQIYMLDERYQPAPIGVAGELHIGGAGLARGYVNRADLTAERFVPDPFANGGSRLYRTGDLARYGENGEVEYVGRIDHQVKVRGYRIEMGEIESILTEHEGVKECLVCVGGGESGDKRLIGYIVPAGNSAPASSELRDHLQRVLPDYMVPAVFVEMSKLPLTPNGKIDRKALPVPETAETVADIERPRTAVEEIVAGIWCEVLQLDEVGRHQNFFELGGHSLLATRVISRVRSALQVEVPLRALFENPTVAGLARVVEQERGAGGRIVTPRIKPVERDGPLPLSFAQMRMWFLHQLDAESAVYNVPYAVRIEGVIAVSALLQNFQSIANRHEVFRTTFEALGGKPVQVINEPGEIEFPVWDIGGLAPGEREQRSREIALSNAARSFDLTRGPLWRVGLVRFEQEHHLLLLCMHHVVIDGWSMGVLVKEFAALYEAYRGGSEVTLPDPPIQYADFAIWQREWLQGEVLEAEMNYWQRQLSGLPMLDLPTDRPRQTAMRSRVGRVPFRLSAHLTRELTEFSRRKGVTSFMTLLAAFQIVLGRHSGQADIAVGTPVANRNRLETEGLIGFFVNQLVLRTDLSGNPSFREILDRVRETTLGAYAHQDVPFEKLVEQIAPERDLTGSPLFRVELVLQNAVREIPHIEGVALRSVASHNGVAKFDLTLSVYDDKDGMGGTAEYATDLYDGSSIERMLGHLRRVLETLAADAELRPDEMSLLTQEEWAQVVEWNQTETGYPSDKCVHELFEQQVQETPEAVGVVCRDQQLSYWELNRRANRLAHFLLSRGVSRESMVAVMLDRSAELIVATLAILKAGAAYMPIDPGYPTDRVRFMINDGKVRHSITVGSEADRLRTMVPNICCPDEHQSEIDRQPSTAPETVSDPADLAYCIYTSGSTGQPNGVMIQHRNIVRLMINDDRKIKATASDVWTMFHSYSFDFSVWEMYGALLNGGKVIVVADDVRKDPVTFAELLVEEGVTALCQTPSYFYGLIDALLSGGGPGLPVKYIMFGAEALRPASLKKFKLAYPDIKLINMYGITETTVHVTYHEISEAEMESSASNVGMPLATTTTYLLDDGLNVVPIRVTGEIHVGGDGLARGYLNRPELTAERFRPDGISGRLGSRLYKAGDLARYGADGTLEYIGRRDHQVKLRGYRIELAEIESVLSRHPEVRQCAVCEREDLPGDKRLVAYVVPSSQVVPDRAKLRSYLRMSLPEHMLPSAFVGMASLPLTLNGKLNRKALPAPPSIDQAVVNHEDLTPIQEIIAAIWAEVLRLERVDLNENFFELGGHSLLATQVMSRIREVLEVEAPLKVLFQSPTVAGLGEAVEKERRVSGLPEAPAMLRVSREGGLPLSFAQQRLWFIHQLEPSSGAYNVPIALRGRGALNIPALQQGLGEIVRRHEVLRTRIEVKLGRAVQVIDEFDRTDVPVWDVSDLGDEERQQLVRKIAAQHGLRPFHLERGPVWRAALVQMGVEDHVLLLSMHHIMTDAWSRVVLVREISALYEAFREYGPSPLPELEIQYGDFAVWQREWLQGQVVEEELEYWRRQLAGAPVLEVPTDRARPVVTTNQGGTVRFALTGELPQKLKELGRREGVTLFMELLAGFQMLLGRYAGQEDVVVGADVANRNRLKTEGLIGFFINQLVLRTDLSGNPSFRKLLGRVREVTLDAYAHQDLPFERLVDELHPERDLSRPPLIQVKLLLQNAPKTSMRLGEVTLQGFGVENSQAKLDLILVVEETGEGVIGGMEYATDLFDAITIERFCEHLRILLQRVVSDPDAKISEIDYLSEGERRQLVDEWNDTATENGRELCIHELFDQQTEKTPDRIAVARQERCLSYEQLNRSANQLAHYLQTLGVEPDVTVAVYLNRGLEMVIAVLGILKAGGAYLPIDPTYPTERVGFMLEDAEAVLVLTEELLETSLPALRSIVVNLDSEWEEIRQHTDVSPRTSLQPDNLAYLIYTSGSTGRPKGVMVTQGGLTNYVEWSRSAYRVEEGTGAPLHSSLGFDLTVTSFWTQLVAGGKLDLVEESGDVGALAEQMRESHGYSLVKLTPSHLRVLSQMLGGEELSGCTGALVIGGEALQYDDIAYWQDKAPQTRVINEYGPTEAVVGCCAYEADTEERWSREVPIGTPIANTRVYVLDNQKSLVGIGMYGELHIAGAGVARGYMRRADQTAQSFIPDPNSKEAGGRQYRTGDKVRWRRDGELEYSGRLDNQVKIRGYRIELGEIETVLAQHRGVRQCAVAIKEEEGVGKRLVAYLVASGERPPASEELRDHLQGKLPEYMVPWTFVELSEMPLTANGKLDRKALPEPAASNETGGVERPRTPIEEIVAGIWTEVLRLERVDLDQCFFELGGHSLLATQVMSRVREAFEVELGLRVLFETSTVVGLAAAVEQARAEGQVRTAPAIRPANRNRELPLSYAQQRLWFIHQLDPDSAAYNIPVAVRMRGELRVSVVKKSLTEIVSRHEVLRTRFESDNGIAVQVIDDPEEVELRLCDLRDLPESERERWARVITRQEASRRFDLANGPLMRAALVQLENEEHLLLVTTHHIISDGWSLGVMVKEFVQLYGGHVNGGASGLSELPIQYADFAKWQREWLSGAVLEEQISYWKDEMAGVEALELPTDRQRREVPSHTGLKARIALTEELTANLKRLSRREGVTVFMTLLAGYQVALSAHSGQTDIVVGTPIAGRTRKELEGLVGLFANTIVLRTDLSDNPTVSQLLGRVREKALAAYGHQELPFEKLVEELQPPRSLSRHPLFQVMFAFQNIPQEVVRLAGVALSYEPVESQRAKFELTLGMVEERGSIHGTLEYASDLFDDSRIQRMTAHVARVLEGMAANEQRRVMDIPLLSEQETEQVVAAWNRTESCVPEDRCIHEMFEEQVNERPDGVAIEYQNEQVSYKELNERANRVGNYLRRMGVGPETRVAVSMERRIDMVVGLLGVLKAGGAYVPLDLNYPQARITYMLEDSQATTILTNGEARLDPNGPFIARNVVSLNSKEIEKENTASPERIGGNDSLAYIIYTSGSTGRPKGVGLAHRNAVTFLNWAGQVYSTELLQGMLASTSICFDLSIFELFLPLCFGGRILLVENVLSLLGLPLGGEVTIINTVPTAIEELLSNGVVPTSIRIVNVAGEALKSDLVDKVYSSCPIKQLYNLYGPTETTTYSAFAAIERRNQSVPPIGRPISNTRVYILDERMMPAPIGAPGELYIGGEGVARGYLNRPEVTGERFLADPFGNGERLYRTGDLVRYREDGNIEYLGRMDYQVKVRGYRIELGEIESALLLHEGIQHCAVCVREDERGDKCLAAYVVPSTEKAPATAGLRGYLMGKLPEYMVPSVFVELPELPLTPNGKLDRKALPAPEPASRGKDSQGARTPNEEILAGIWAEALGVDQVGVDQSFFELGGHSLLAMRVISRTSDVLGVEIPLRVLFESPTVAGLATAIERERRAESRTGSRSISPVNRKRELSLSYAQQRLWFIQQLEPDSAAYNIPFAVRLEGVLSVPALEQSLRQVVRRHEVLRTRFEERKGGPVQIIGEAWEIPVPVRDMESVSILGSHELLRVLAGEEGGRPFNLERGPVLRVGLTRMGEHDHILSLCLHHVAADAWSTGVLVKELTTFYESYRDGNRAALPELPVQYADFASWQREWLTPDVLGEQMGYWKEQLAGAPAVVALPLDRPRPVLSKFRGGREVVQFSPGLRDELVALSRSRGATLFMTLLAAFNILLYRYTGQEDIVVGTSVGNRRRSEIEGLIGFFVSNLVLRTSLSGQLTFRDFLVRVREVCLGAYDHQDLPFEKLVEELRPERSLSHNPLFQVIFLMQNGVGSESKVPGLKLSHVGVDDEISKFDLSLSILETDRGLSASLGYNTELFDDSTVKQMLAQYHRLLENILENPEENINRLSLTRPEDSQRLIGAFNDALAIA